MAVRLNPYLSFAGDARAAMEFYQGVFGGELSVSTFGEFGEPDAPGADGVMHAQLEAGDTLVLMAADTPPGMEHQPGTNVALSLSGDDAETLRGYWTALSADGEIQVPLEMQMWGDEFGQCVDRFGIVWMVNIAGEQAESTEQP
ncbi:VOC family protein [Auraticoccus sp. F435]|uniref:VOC family protein n=1 Tax=Auraticoccus cholistanensis TaxID=2656650 RepID=A0A6A9UQ38_9ACTN|nr:VOC family protein [Auraticoccus cholistanensis]MVA74791.1 VOC family protein [Auraticoccus cholistanensis]